VPRIRILPEILASQVAAGEVVERPASAVKELVEHSLDAGAGEILVEIRRGGAALLRVIDAGSGMSRDDALLSLERHATSKLSDSAGLATIRTLGFRGEAVPSIASVSRFRLNTQWFLVGAAAAALKSPEAPGATIPNKEKYNGQYRTTR
jgi:DNA mismatch repair protein MutL